MNHWKTYIVNKSWNISICLLAIILKYPLMEIIDLIKELFGNICVEFNLDECKHLTSTVYVKVTWKYNQVLDIHSTGNVFLQIAHGVIINDAAIGWENFTQQVAIVVKVHVILCTWKVCGTTTKSSPNRCAMQVFTMCNLTNDKESKI